MIPNCNQTRCAFQTKCERFNPDGSNTPILMFITEEPSAANIPDLNGCVDYWPTGTSTEFFLEPFKKTPTT
jgi:hypothetical protein